MADMFTLDLSELKKLKKFAHKNPPAFKRAYARTLNGLAWALKKEIPNQLGKQMTIRNPQFVNSKIRVQNARSSGEISNQQAIAGSIYGPRFSGWREQITGESSDKNRITTGQSRGGQFKNQVRKQVRMNKVDRFHSQKQFQNKQWGKTRGQRTVAMVEAIRKGKASNKPFIIGRGLPGRLGNIRYGVYEINSGKMSALQLLRRKQRAKRFDWATASINAVGSKFNLKNEWAKNISKVLK